ncbi:carbamoyltransferase HypF [bacterium]|nr:carbamoyltransferase HypF [bacterium]
MSIRADKLHAPEDSTGRRCRRRIRVSGTVQGVGFRPFVYRLAIRHGLGGFVCNDDRGVLVEIEGATDSIVLFEQQLTASAPPQASITRLEGESIVPSNVRTFDILPSKRNGSAETRISPDIAVCDDCLKEMFDPGDRRFAYPFINCTNCGPRYSIVDGIPYDRPYTTMRSFAMCPACAKEYGNPLDRRFHAQPVSCPNCGPRLWLTDGNREIACTNPIGQAVLSLKRGQMVAIRGIGGFHLAVDATNEPAVARLRRRKHRDDKPLAVMMPDLDVVRRYCLVSEPEAHILTGSRRPILLLRRRGDAPPLAPSIAPDGNMLGVLLPYAPIQHLLFQNNAPVLVMTSGNLSEEPIAIGNGEAVSRLQSVADLFLLHDREIVQRCDDSIVRVLADVPRVMRRSRGYAPTPIALPFDLSRPLLACGADLKNTFAFGRGNEVVLSQHIGDLDNTAAFDGFTDGIAHLGKLLRVQPTVVACDLHPGYRSTIWAHSQSNFTVIPVQHHHAHLASVMAENGVTDKTIGIILDGTGYGPDGTIWGGEILIGDYGSFQRFAWLEPVPMPGADRAARQPWRMAVSHLWHAGVGRDEIRDAARGWGIEPDRVTSVLQMLDRTYNSPGTSGCGRLFDAVSAILGLCTENTYEAKAAMMLECVAGEEPLNESEFDLAVEPDTASGPLSCSRLVLDMFNGVRTGTDPRTLARHFHLALAERFISVALAAAQSTGLRQIALSGGVFQNRLLFEHMLQRLVGQGFRVLTHEQVSTNDGGIALGQIAVANALLTARETA